MAALRFWHSARFLYKIYQLVCTIASRTTLRGHPWPEIFNLRAVIVDRILRSPLRIRRSSRNAVIRPPNAASLAVRQRRANKVGEAPGIVRLHPMEHLSSAPAAASQLLFHLNRAAIVPYFAGTAIRLAKAAAAAPVQDAIRTKPAPMPLLRCQSRISRPRKKAS
jgi:hypothetical protein